MYARGEMRQFFAGESLLAFAQVGAHFKYGITIRQRIPFFQFAEDVQRQFAATRAEFEDSAVNWLHYFDQLSRHGATEQNREFRCGDEIALLAELRAPAV